MRIQFRLSPLFVGVLLLAILQAYGLPSLLKRLPKGMARDNVKRHVKDFWDQEQGGDSWWPMSQAYEYLFWNRSGLYQRVFFEQGIKFQYPPSALLLYSGLECVDPTPVGIALRYGDLFKWMVGKRGWLDHLERISRRCTIVALLLCVLILLVSAGPAEPWLGKLFLMLAGAWGGLYYYPLVKAYTLGQIQTLLAMFAAGALLAYMQGWRVLAGAILALGTLAKPQMGFLLIWGLVRRRWDFVLGFLAVLGVGAVVSVLLFGWDTHLEYLGVMKYLAAHGEGYFANHSMNGLMNRWLANGPNLNWEKNSFPPYHPVVYWTTLLSSIALLFPALWPPRHFKACGSPVDMAMAILPVVIASPVAWEHHYNLLLPVFALVAPIVALPHPARRWRVAVLVLAFVLTGNMFEFTKLLANTWLNPLQSYSYFGGLSLYALLWHLRGEQSDTSEAVSA